MSDYVINYGKPNQWRGTLAIVDVSDDESTRYVATMYNVATDEIVSRWSCPTANSAVNAVIDDLRKVFGEVESYQRSKHRDMALSKVGKRSQEGRGNVL